MTVLEAISHYEVPPSIFSDRLGIGEEKIRRLLANMEYLPDTGCWGWTKAKTKGYGVVRIRKLSASLFPVHRLCYELANGAVDKDLHVHHKVEAPVDCIGRACGNPDHVTPVTVREHIVELTPGTMSNIAAHRNCCAAGHLYTDENTRRDASGRHCRTCEKIRAQLARDRKRGDRKKFSKDPSAFKTHCIRGHEMTDGNSYWYSTISGMQRRCRACQRLREIEFRSKVHD